MGWNTSFTKQQFCYTTVTVSENKLYVLGGFYQFTRDDKKQYQVSGKSATQLFEKKGKNQFPITDTGDFLISRLISAGH